MSIYPTLCDLAGLSQPDHLDGISLLPLLRDPQSEWTQPALTTHGQNRHAVRTEKWRYIRYEDGTEELYDHESDPFEWTNLASGAEFTPIKQQLSQFFPSKNAPEVKKLQ